jgi:MoaA/NifB/PqqE/SkfB family radical SAM enzyme
MQLTGIHILLTYKCLYECDHCFAWGSPWQDGVLSGTQIEEILRQSAEVGTVEWIFFEGGEPFLFYPVLLQAVQRAHRDEFRVGLVSNGYWATTAEDAEQWLRPFVGLVDDLSISNDDYHGGDHESQLASNACAAARRLGIPVDVLAVAQPEESEAVLATGKLPAGTSAVMFRGRAAEALVDRVQWRPWQPFTECPCEDLLSVNRVHLDPLGNVHLCQGISLGNVFRENLGEICERYDPQAHPIVGPLLAGGPAELIARYGLDLGKTAADACHLCYRARCALRERFPDILVPEQMYGVAEAS